MQILTVPEVNSTMKIEKVFVKILLTVMPWNIRNTANNIFIIKNMNLKKIILMSMMAKMKLSNYQI